jgi:hypothetical protein
MNSAKNFEGINRQQHKMKAPINAMGALSLKGLYTEIEIAAKQNTVIDMLTKQIEYSFHYSGITAVFI